MRALLLTVLVLVAAACAPAAEEQEPAAESTSRAACEVRLPGEWQRALADGRVDAGKWSVPIAVGPGGEVVARRGDDVVVIAPDRSVSTVFTSADQYASAVVLNDRWIVLGLNNLEPSNYKVSTELTRIVAIDRRDGSARTVVEITEDDYRTGRNMLDSVAIFGDTVYWITHDSIVAGAEGTLRSHDLINDTEADLESGSMRNIRATATGLVWRAYEPEDSAVFRALVPLPAALSALTGINDDQITLVHDGDDYAWITDIAGGGTGFARSSPKSGLTRVSTVQLFAGRPVEPPLLYIAGPYLLFGKAESAPSTIVDTRSGALALIDYPLIGAANSTIGIAIGDWSSTTVPNTGSVRTESLSPLACSSGDAIRSSCEVPLPSTWRQLFDSVNVTGGSTEPLAVGPAGEVAMSYDDDKDRRLLLMNRSGPATTVYRVRDPDVEKVGYAAITARWIVVGVESDARVRNDGLPYLGDDGEPVADNSPPAKLARVDVIDRKNGAVRTVVERGDSLAVFGERVYWSAATDGAETAVRSYDLNTNAVVQIAAADHVQDIRATPTGVVWTEGDGEAVSVPHHVTDLPPDLAAAGVARGDESLVTDGTSYAWLTDDGIGHWSPDGGVTRIATVDMWRFGRQPIRVVGPYVIGEGTRTGAGDATVVDTRSGAVTVLDVPVAAVGGGTIATAMPPNMSNQSATGVIRIAELPPLTCEG